MGAERHSNATAVLLVALLGCSTSGSHVDAWDFKCRSEVELVSADISESEQAHLVGITSVLARHGLQLVSDPHVSSDLQLKFKLSTRNPFDFRCTVVLLDRGTPIVSAESVNPGWGNLLARGGNIRAIVRRATRQFDKELQRMDAGHLAASCR